MKFFPYKAYKRKRFKRKNYLKYSGIFAKDRKQSLRYTHGSPKNQKILEGLYKDKYKNLMVLEFLEFMQWHVGEKLKKKNKNMNILRDYVYLFKGQNAIYNPYELLLNLRILLTNLTLRMVYKKKCLINYAPNKTRKSHILGGKPIEKYAKRMFMVTWKKWMGGVLTNFKAIAKRIVAQLKKRYAKKAIAKQLVAYPRNIPRLPHFLISTADCHWALNESRLIRITSCQIITCSHLGTLGNMPLAMNTTYFALRRFTALLEECASSMKQTLKIFHKKRILKRIRRRVKKKGRQFQKKWKAAQIEKSATKSSSLSYNFNLTKTTQPRKPKSLYSLFKHLRYKNNYKKTFFKPVAFRINVSRRGLFQQKLPNVT